MQTDYIEAEKYAFEKLCNVPNTYQVGSTYFDRNTNTCKISKKACEFKSGQSIFSQSGFDGNGNSIKQRYKNDLRRGKFWSAYPPEQLIWKAVENGREGCGRSNSMIYNFCEHPKKRLGGKQKSGITDTDLKMDYVISQGKETCAIPNSYCKAKGVSYDSGKQKCVVPYNQKVGEFFGGTTLSRLVRSGKRAPSDKRLKKDLKVVKKDMLAPGIHFYSYYWNDYAVGMFNLPQTIQLGFIAQELPKDMVITDLNGIIYINLESSNPLTKYLKMCMNIIKMLGV